MYQLEEKTYFIYFFAVAGLVVAFLLLQIWKRKRQKQFANAGLLDKLAPSKSVFKSVLKMLTIAVALAALVIALVNPKMGTKLETVNREGVDVVFALDVSKSMLAEDIAPSRLAKAKQIITKTINNLASDRVGIIIYAGSSYPLLPITTDQAAAKMFLQNASPDMVSSQGTAINEALRLAKSFYDNEDQTNRYLFLISDGEDHEESKSTITSELVKEGIKVYTVGVGTTKGAPIPIKVGNNRIGFKKDRKGETVITKLYPDLLKEISLEGRGEYLDGNDTKTSVEFISKLLLNADKKTFEAKNFSDYKDQFQWFVGIGFFLLLLDLFFLERKTKWIQKLNLFNEK